MPTTFQVETLRTLRPIKIAGGDITRTLVRVEREPIVIFEKNHPILPSRCRSETDWQELLDGSLGTPVRQATICDTDWFDSDPMSYNCHFLCLSRYVEFKKPVWIEGMSGIFTLMENPARVLLDHLFFEVARWYDQESIDWRQHRPLPGDVLVLEQTTNDALVHSGLVLLESAGQLSILSKLGEQRPIVSDLGPLRNEFAGQFNCVAIYRAVGKPSRES